ncbi:nuclear transport factor 2 family protein [Catenulispora rubra]|uniref:nuclear transport factor 2 family protein n=1 Tax=Catenulispora rubra TaxID=280293 RepID=UPI001891F587|nr:nuclear transport factor 2 family protein [Catenulispora rubra]
MTQPDTQSAATTTEVIERLRAAMESGQNDQFISQFAPDAVYETPFGLDGPKRWEGFEAISEHLQGVAANSARSLLTFDKVTVTVHPGADPDQATAQFTVEGTVKATGEPFVLPSSIGVIRVHNGKIAGYQDYTNTLRGAQLVGGLERFAAMLVKTNG